LCLRGAVLGFWSSLLQLLHLSSASGEPIRQLLRLCLVVGGSSLELCLFEVESSLELSLPLELQILEESDLLLLQRLLSLLPIAFSLLILGEIMTSANRNHLIDSRNWPESLLDGRLASTVAWEQLLFFLGLLRMGAALRSRDSNHRTAFRNLSFLVEKHGSQLLPLLQRLRLIDRLTWSHLRRRQGLTVKELGLAQWFWTVFGLASRLEGLLRGLRFRFQFSKSFLNRHQTWTR